MSSPLRKIEIVGPSRRDQNGKDVPFWRIVADSPSFNVDNVDDHGGVLADSVHQLRNLSLDPLGSSDWLKPRTIDVHAATGDRKMFSDAYPRQLSVRVTTKKDATTDVLRTADQANLRTDGKDLLPRQPGFQRLVVAPMLEADDKWPRRPAGGEHGIYVPRVRLLQGGLRLVVAKDGLPWLKKLWKAVPGLKLDTVNEAMRIWLMPDGLIVHTEAALPGLAARSGRFLIAPDGDGLSLTLLSNETVDPEFADELSAPADWLKDWRRLTPTQNREDFLPGFKVDPARAVAPRFSWRLEWMSTNQVRIAEGFVRVPATDVAVKLTGPDQAKDLLDGVAELKPLHYWLALPAKATPPAPLAAWAQTPAAGHVVLWAEIEATSGTGPADRLRLDSEGAKLTARLESRSASALSHACAVDDVDLARDLRRAYGIADPPPGRTDPKQPLLWAFAPLDDGWLQLPAPNTPAPDIEKDDQLLLPPKPAPGSAFSGFLRFQKQDVAPGLLSAFADPPKMLDEAPWSVTVESAASAAVAVRIKVGAEAAAGELMAAAATLDGPELSTRGLLWLSADRPDGVEALPRLGAGPAAFLDLPLESAVGSAPQGVACAFKQLSFSLSRGFSGYDLNREDLGVAVGLANGALARLAKPFEEDPDAKDTMRDVLMAEAVVLEGTPPAAPFAWSPPAVAWLRNPRMPLAAVMPMTRSVASAVRPLESRDLVPFRFAATAEGALCVLRWARAVVFPEVLRPDASAAPAYRLVRGWPALRDGTKPEEVGIPFCAFGVPGLELSWAPDQAATADPWADFLAAARYDLPASDEAFATASLPAGMTAVPEAPRPVATALRWAELAALWRDQARRRRLAMVVGSYLYDYFPIRSSAEREVRDLIGGLTWKTKLAFKAPLVGDAVPYGRFQLADESLAGGRALRGLSGDFTIDGDKLKPGAGIKVRGYSPGSYVVDGFLTDARRTGVAVAAVGALAVWRPLRSPKLATLKGLATLNKSMSVKHGDSSLFQFWVKDLPIAGDGAAVLPDETLDFSAWLDDHLPRLGFEWRFVPAAASLDALREGLDRFALNGLQVEPLRLLACKLGMTGNTPNGRVLSAQILARLHLGPHRRSAQPIENLVLFDLKGNGDDLQVESLTSRDGALRFVLDAEAAVEEGEAPVPHRRRAIVQAAIAWDKTAGKPLLNDASLTLEMFGSDITLSPATVTLEPAGKVKVAWVAPSAEPAWANNGWMRVLEAVVTTTTGASATPEYRLRRELVVTPAQTGEPASSTQKALQIVLSQDAVVQTTIFGLNLKEAKPRFSEREGAFAVTLSPKRTRVSGDAVAVLRPPGDVLKAGFGWLASLAAPSATVMGACELPAGRLDGALWLDPDPDDSAARRVDIREIAFEAVRAERAARPGLPPVPPPPWVGGLRLFGWIRAPNAIAWPALKLEEKEPPWGGMTGDNGRIDVALADPAVTRTHHVTYELNAHRMSFALAIRLFGLEAGAQWTAPAIATHVIETGDKDVRWQAVETLALGNAETLVPKAATYLTTDPVTFAPRYQNKIIDGEISHNDDDDEPGMTHTGEGRVGHVLSGALGAQFRQMFWSGPRSGLYLVGGFVGLLTAGEGAPAELTRLPVVCALSARAADDPLAKQGSLHQTDWPDTSLELAWADAWAAQTVLTSLAGAVAPTSGEEAALRAALRAGRWAPAKPKEKPTGEVPALFVEQSFAAPFETQAVGRPYFLASAVTVERALSRFPASAPAPTVVSVLAGRLTGMDLEDRTLAASVLTRGVRPAPAAAAVRASELVTLGEDVVVRPWTSPGEGETVSASVVAGPAFADHVEPRLAMARVLAKGEWIHTVFDLPRRDWTVRESASAKLAFADAHRGYLADVTDVGPLLTPVEEGATRPFVDAESPPTAAAESLRSGVAGLSRVVAFPGWAAAEANLKQWVWYAQHRTPVFEPARFVGLSGPPIPHLSPAAARPRVPTEAATDRALESAGVDAAIKIQAIVPAAATIGHFADRPGVLMARVSRLETALGAVPFFDPVYERFGRPAQSGMATSRIERPPRPGPLPPNTGDPLRDRRPCASSVLSRAPLKATIGPGDAVGGDMPAKVKNAGGDVVNGRVAWSAAVVAAEAWRGVVSPVWDGTVRLDVEIDIAPFEGDMPSVAQAVAGLLLGVPNDETPSARAQLAIGKQVITYASLHLVAEPKFVAVTGPSLGGQPSDVFFRGRAALILDLRDVGAPRTPSTPSEAIAKALADPDAARSVEVRLTVQPGSQIGTADAKDSYGLATTELDLPSGRDRTPSTLRMPLFARQENRGVLPLAPSTALFIDPSYDAELGSKPAEHSARLPDNPQIPKGRGDLALVLSADRARANVAGTVTFMADLRFERAAEGKLAEAVQGAEKPVVDGDLYVGVAHDQKPDPFRLDLRVVRQNGELRPLGLLGGKDDVSNPNIEIGRVYELDLARLKEAHGGRAQLQPGDVLEITIAEVWRNSLPDKEKFAVWDVNKNDGQGKALLDRLDVTSPAVRTLRIVLTEEAVVEPPPSLYAALARRTQAAEPSSEQAPKAGRLSLPLYAQSPLPPRVELRSPKADFRAGYMRRMATFAWGFSRPVDELDTERFGVHVVKNEKTGQGFWPPPDPATVAELGYFIKPRRL